MEQIAKTLESLIEGNNYEGALSYLQTLENPTALIEWLKKNNPSVLSTIEAIIGEGHVVFPTPQEPREEVVSGVSVVSETPHTETVEDIEMKKSVDKLKRYCEFDQEFAPIYLNEMNCSKTELMDWLLTNDKEFLNVLKPMLKQTQIVKPNEQPAIKMTSDQQLYVRNSIASAKQILEKIILTLTKRQGGKRGLNNLVDQLKELNSYKNALVNVWNYLTDNNLDVSEFEQEFRSLFSLFEENWQELSDRIDRLTQEVDKTSIKPGTEGVTVMPDSQIEHTINHSLDSQGNITVADVLVEAYSDVFRAVNPKGPVFVWSKEETLWEEVSVQQFSTRVIEILRLIYQIRASEAEAQLKAVKKDSEGETRIKSYLVAVTNLLKKLDVASFCHSVSSWVCNATAQRSYGALFDSLKGFLPCKGGQVIDMRTGKASPSLSEHMFTIRINVGYNPSRGYATVEKIIREMMLEDKCDETPLTDCLQILFGYIISGDLSQKLFPILIGAGDNGKSLLIAGMTELLGNFMKTADKSVLIKSKQSSGPSPELHMLRSCRVAHLPETNHGEYINEDLVKKITGKDMMVSRDPYEGYMEWKPKFVPIMATNNEPETSGDNATLNRCFMFRFRARFCDKPILDHERKVDLNLFDIWEKDEYLEELLNWLIAGSVKFYQFGKIPKPDAVRVDNEEYRLGQDPNQSFFEQDIEFTTDKSDEVSAKMLFDRYQARCETMGRVCRYKNQASFGKFFTDRLKRHFVTNNELDFKKHSKRGTTYTQIKLKEDTTKPNGHTSLLSF